MEKGGDTLISLRDVLRQQIDTQSQIKHRNVGKNRPMSPNQIRAVQREFEIEASNRRRNLDDAINRFSRDLTRLGLTVPTLDEFISKFVEGRITPVVNRGDSQDKPIPLVLEPTVEISLLPNPEIYLLGLWTREFNADETRNISLRLLRSEDLRLINVLGRIRTQEPELKPDRDLSNSLTAKLGELHKYKKQALIAYERRVLDGWFVGKVLNGLKDQDELQQFTEFGQKYTQKGVFFRPLSPLESFNLSRDD
jgi:hypothetical protein